MKNPDIADDSINVISNLLSLWPERYLQVLLTHRKAHRHYRCKWVFGSQISRGGAKKLTATSFGNKCPRSSLFQSTAETPCGVFRLMDSLTSLFTLQPPLSKATCNWEGRVRQFLEQLGASLRGQWWHHSVTLGIRTNNLPITGTAS